MKGDPDSRDSLVDFELLPAQLPIDDLCTSERIILYMIVMKFGGTSVESSDAIGRLVGTVNSHLAQRPVVVVSALGKTTNRLLEFADHARRGELYLGSKCLTELQDYHFEVAGQVANGETLASGATLR